MSLIQLKLFNKVETGLSKLPCFEPTHFQMGVSETGVTVVAGHNGALHSGALLRNFVLISTNKRSHGSWEFLYIHTAG